MSTWSLALVGVRSTTRVHKSYRASPGTGPGPDASLGPRVRMCENVRSVGVAVVKTR